MDTLDEELPPGLHALLDAERARPPPPARVKQRVRERVSLAIAALPALGEPSLPGEVQPPAPPSLPEPVTSAALGDALSVWAKTKLVIGVTSFAAGGLTGAGVHAVATATTGTTIAGEPSAVHRAAGDVSPPVAELAPPSPPPLVQAELEPVELGPAAPKQEDGTRRGEEVRLLERARAALARGLPQEALSALATHELRHGDSPLAEEREALRIQALVSVGRGAEAEERGRAFRRRFPRSLLTPVVDATLEAIAR